MNFINASKAFIAVIGGGLSFLFGGFDMLLVTLTVFVVIDYITGISAAVIEKTLCSRTGFVGIVKKVCIFLVVILGNLAGNLTGITALRDIVVSFYLANEGISILENLGRIGVPFPKKLMEVLEQLKKED